MFGYQRNPANAYAKVGLETGVTAATPHKLIVMLFDGALVAIRQAEQHMAAKDILAKGEAINKATTIILNGLQASLNVKAGGELAENLYALYDYMARQLNKAHARNDPRLLQEVHVLLSDLKTAWEQINPQSKPLAKPPSVGS